jgi:hypothetical protein
LLASRLRFGAFFFFSSKFTCDNCFTAKKFPFFFSPSFYNYFITTVGNSWMKKKFGLISVGISFFFSYLLFFGCCAVHCRAVPWDILIFIYLERFRKTWFVCLLFSLTFYKNLKNYF